MTTSSTNDGTGTLHASGYLQLVKGCALKNTDEKIEEMKWFALPESSKVQIGRHFSSDIVIDDLMCSSLHCSILATKASLPDSRSQAVLTVYRDCTNGVLKNGCDLIPSGKSIVLKHNDTFHIIFSATYAIRNVAFKFISKYAENNSDEYETAYCSGNISSESIRESKGGSHEMPSETITVSTSVKKVETTTDKLSTPKDPIDSVHGDEKIIDDSLNAENIFICDICKEVFFDPATCQPCLHSFCSGCISQWIKNRSTCPTCRAQLNGVSKNHWMRTFVGQFLKDNPEKEMTAAMKNELTSHDTLPKSGMKSLSTHHTHGSSSDETDTDDDDDNSEWEDFSDGTESDENDDNDEIVYDDHESERNSSASNYEDEFELDNHDPNYSVGGTLAVCRNCPDHENRVTGDAPCTDAGEHRLCSCCSEPVPNIVGDQSLTKPLSCHLCFSILCNVYFDCSHADASHGDDNELTTLRGVRIVTWMDIRESSPSFLQLPDVEDGVLNQFDYSRVRNDLAQELKARLSQEQYNDREVRIDAIRDVLAGVLDRYGTMMSKNFDSMAPRHANERGSFGFLWKTLTDATLTSAGTLISFDTTPVCSSCASTVYHALMFLYCRDRDIASGFSQSPCPSGLHCTRQNNNEAHAKALCHTVDPKPRGLMIRPVDDIVSNENSVSMVDRLPNNGESNSSTPFLTPR